MSVASSLNDEQGPEIVVENKNKILAGTIVFELLFIFLGLVQVDSRLTEPLKGKDQVTPRTGAAEDAWSGFSKVGEGLSGNYFTGVHLEQLIALLFFAGVSFLTIFIALYYRESNLVQRFSLLITMVFAYTVTTLINMGTNNLILMYFSLTFLPTIHWYYLKNGELGSFLNNHVVVFALRRSIAIVPMFLAISFMTFMGVNLIGDPVEIATARIRFGKEQVQKTLLRRYGLVDDNQNLIPVWKRYFIWLYDFMHFDLGISYEFLTPVTEIISRGLFPTLVMQVSALILSFILSVVIGMAAAYYHRTALDTSISATALLGLSMPIFVSGILAIIIFGGTGFQLFPGYGMTYDPYTKSTQYACRECIQEPGEIWNQLMAGGGGIGLWFDFIKVSWYYGFDIFMHLVLPVATLTFATMATFSRLTRSTMLEVIQQDYILAARANGLSESVILRRHALRNVLLPLVTFLGIRIGFLLAGAPITETVFSFPGLGNQFIDSLFSLDMPVLIGLTMIITLMILFANLITDISYTYLDPRITL